MPVKIEDINKIYMDLALMQCEKALEIDEIPVGCVVIRNKDIIEILNDDLVDHSKIIDFASEKILTKAHNLTNTNSDPLAHAEHLCIQYLIKNNINTDDLVFYITLEPCAMCIGILERIQAKVIFGYHNDIFGAKRILNKDCGECMNDTRCIEILKKFYKTPNKNTMNL